ncbi:MAG: glycosyltransferase family 4 protein [Bryobacterales bacterium]|jgi:glycosyltransferase involved in cell wall biosynthesis|nr:glycosyltransferase family 4 protein [Bryobacterales bacterium]
MRGLSGRGFPVGLIAPEGSPLALRAREAGLEVTPIASGGNRFAAAMALRAHLRRGGVRLIHCHDAHSLTAAWLAGVHRRCPIVASRRLANRLSQNLVGLARYRSAARILAVSEFVRSTVLASGLPPECVEVVYDGVPVPALPSQAEREAARRRWCGAEHASLFGCVGYLLPEKGQEILLRAVPLVLRELPGCRLILAGDGPCRPGLERLASELGVADSVLFAGHVEDVASVYCALDAFVFPSLAEPLGSSLLAAMAYGLPPVGVARGAVPEIIQDGRNGLLASAPAPEEIAALAVRLLRDHDLAARLGAEARATIQQRFSADRMVEDTLRVYSQL